MKLHRDSNGSLPAYVWPGGYPIAYLCADGGTLCPACANGENGSDAAEGDNDPQWNIIAGEVYWEGPALQCDHCNVDIESAYGDPDGEGDQ